MAVKITYRDKTTEIIPGASGWHEDKASGRMIFKSSAGDDITVRQTANIEDVRVVEEPLK